jgi:hypothetical protein
VGVFLLLIRCPLTVTKDLVSLDCTSFVVRPSHVAKGPWLNALIQVDGVGLHRTWHVKLLYQVSLLGGIVCNVCMMWCFMAIVDAGWCVSVLQGGFHRLVVGSR